MHEIQWTLPDPHHSPAGSRLVLEVNTVMGMAIPGEAIQRGLDAAHAVLVDAGVSDYVAWSASRELDRDWHDAMENPDLDQEGMDYYRALAEAGNAWQRAERAALVDALRDEREEKHEYRMYVVWDAQPGPVDESWGYIDKRHFEGPVFQWDQ